MKTKLIGVIAALGLAFATAASAASVKLTPANPQPSGLKPGLSVTYGWLGNPPQKFQSLSGARSFVDSNGKRGAPLRGLDYRDTNDGDPVMTHKQHYNVAAKIGGYIKFDAPGTYDLEVWSNDGVDARVSGQSIGLFDGRQGCEPNQRVTAIVPKAGWYDLKLYYYQKYGTSCLMMKWAPSGSKMKWVPNSAFAYR